MCVIFHFFMQSELILDANYHVEEHKVQTDDGYILTIFKIPARAQNDGKATKKGFNKEPVLLLHGLMGSSSHWLFQKREDALRKYEVGK